jgi:hypothetical protein
MFSAHASLGRARQDRTGKTPGAAPRIGDKIELIVGYSDTTIHLHEEPVGVRKRTVETVWRIAGHGKFK